MTTLKEARELLGAAVLKTKVSIANALLGKYKGILPKGKISTSAIRGLRANLYGKIK